MAPAAGMPGTALAANVCLELTADSSRFVLRGLKRRIPRGKAGAVTGYFISAAGTTVRPVFGSYVSNAAGTSMGIGLIEAQVPVTAAGGGSTPATRVMQILANQADRRLDVGDTFGAFCTWTHLADGTTPGGCSGDVVVRDCRQLPPIP